jgi:hypothetical protein
MNRIVLTTALVLGLGAPVLASDQLALSLGVAPGVYTAAQLSQLKAAQDDDHGTGTYMIDGVAVRGSSKTGEASPGKVQLAASLGVDPARFTLSELAQMHFAASEDSGNQ